MERKRVRAGIAGALLIAGLAGVTTAAGATTTGPTGPTGPTGTSGSTGNTGTGFGYGRGPHHHPIHFHTGDGVSGASGASGASGPSGASGASSSGFLKEQAALEQQLALRVTRLNNLSSDITGAKSLTSAHVTLLDTRLAAEKTSIEALVTKVPTDTTTAQLKADATTMLADNRVFAVMSPQVFETIGGDAVLAATSTLSLEQASLLSEVTSLAGDPGYNNANNHYQDFVRRIAGVSTSIAADEVNELAQTPQGYPGNQHVFEQTNRDILKANISLAYATYDASIIGLATGGYTGS